MKATKKYNINKSPFYNKNEKLRANLTELKASNGEEVVLARKRYFKQDEYIKFIINKEFNISAFNKLPKISSTILMYIVYYCLEYNNPSFRIKASEVALILNIDTSIVFRGLKSLLDIKYIARTRTKEVYWINHNLFYKGNFIVDKHLIIKNNKK